MTTQLRGLPMIASLQLLLLTFMIRNGVVDAVVEIAALNEHIVAKYGGQLKKITLDEWLDFCPAHQAKIFPQGVVTHEAFLTWEEGPCHKCFLGNLDYFDETKWTYPLILELDWKDPPLLVPDDMVFPLHIHTPIELTELLVENCWNIDEITMTDRFYKDKDPCDCEPLEPCPDDWLPTGGTGRKKKRELISGQKPAGQEATRTGQVEQQQQEQQPKRDTTKKEDSDDDLIGFLEKVGFRMPTTPSRGQGNIKRTLTMTTSLRGGWVTATNDEGTRGGSQFERDLKHKKEKGMDANDAEIRAAREQFRQEQQEWRTEKAEWEQERQEWKEYNEEFGTGTAEERRDELDEWLERKVEWLEEKKEHQEEMDEWRLHRKEWHEAWREWRKKNIEAKKAAATTTGKKNIFAKKPTPTAKPTVGKRNVFAKKNGKNKQQGGGTDANADADADDSTNGTCDEYRGSGGQYGGAFGMCNSYCGSKECHKVLEGGGGGDQQQGNGQGQEMSCSQLKEHFIEFTGGDTLPCERGETTQSTTSVPTTPGPTTSLPTPTPAPTTKSPTTALPSTSTPTPAPTTLSPTTPAPTTSSPTTSYPTTEAPSTGVPTTPAPTSSSPTTVAPTILLTTHRISNVQEWTCECYETMM